MFTCITCGAYVEDLYRRYSISVLKVLKCEKCGNLADKYIEYDPVIVLVDLILLEKSAYRHLLYNSNFSSYWKLMIVLILGESFRKWSIYEPKNRSSNFTPFNKNSFFFQGERNFYILSAHTTASFAAFIIVVLLITELRWLIQGKRPRRYKAINLVRALVISGCAKLLGLLGIVWHHVEPEPHNLLIHGYTILCLLTAYSVVCQSGRIGSLVGLAGGLIAHNYICSFAPELYPMTANATLLQQSEDG